MRESYCNICGAECIEGHRDTSDATKNALKKANKSKVCESCSNLLEFAFLVEEMKGFISN